MDSVSSPLAPTIHYEMSRLSLFSIQPDKNPRHVPIVYNIEIELSSLEESKSRGTLARYSHERRGLFLSNDILLFSNGHRFSIIFVLREKLFLSFVLKAQR